MIDIHTHCLPGLDDGSPDTKTSIEMLAGSRKQGVRACFATPHCVLHHPMGLSEFLHNRERSYKRLLDVVEDTDEKLPKIILGAEVYLDHDISEYEDLEKLCLGNTKYMLLEFSREGINPVMVTEWLYSLTVRGIKPVIAHVERYFEWEEIINRTIGMGYIYQLNAENFLSFFGRRYMKKIIEYGQDYIVASDMHNTADRSSKMREAYQKSLKMFPKLTKSMFWDNAYEIIKEDI